MMMMMMNNNDNKSESPDADMVAANEHCVADG